MNRAEARQKDCEIREYLNAYCISNQLSQGFGEIIMDKYLEIIPDDTKRDMIFLGKESVSYKPGNIRFDFRSMVAAAAEFVTSLDKPESIFEYIQLGIVTIFCMEAITKKELSYNEAIIVYVLHERNAYMIGLTQEQLVNEIRTLKEGYKIKNFDFGKLDEAVENLLTWNILDIQEEKIYLKEQVWGKI